MSGCSVSVPTPRSVSADCIICSWSSTAAFSFPCASSSVTPDKNIKLGGIRFYSASRGISINATLDDDLARQKEFFTSLLGPVTSGDGEKETTK